MKDYQTAMSREALLDDFMYVREKCLYIAETSQETLERMKQDIRKEIRQEELSSFYENLAKRFTQMISS